MNKIKYKSAFSKIHPSDKAIERIMDMTETNQRRIYKRGLIAVIVVLSLLFVGGIAANAATDGAVASGVKMILNGEDVDIMHYIKNHKSYVDENGCHVEEIELDIELPDGSHAGAELTMIGFEDSSEICDVIFAVEEEIYEVVIEK